MIYGTLEVAKEYDKAGKIEEWLQLFLRNDGKNVAFADGLLLFPRYYIGPIKITLDNLNFPSRVPDYLTSPDDITYFWQVVDNMKSSIYNGWDVPPLIVNYYQGTFDVNDGRHRYVLYDQLGVKEAEVIFWITEEVDYFELIKIINAWGGN